MIVYVIVSVCLKDYCVDSSIPIELMRADIAIDPFPGRSVALVEFSRVSCYFLCVFWAIVCVLCFGFGAFTEKVCYQDVCMQ